MPDCPERTDRCQVDAYCYPGMCRRLAGHGGQTLYAPLGAFVLLLAKGWRLPFVVEPMAGSHGEYSILLTRGGDGR